MAHGVYQEDAHLMEGTDRTKVTLDDVEERRLAKNEPELFLQI